MMISGRHCEAGGEPNLDDLVQIVAYCSSTRSDHPDYGWDKIEPLLEQGWPAIRGERNTTWEAVRKLAEACWLRDSERISE